MRVNWYVGTCAECDSEVWKKSIEVIQTVTCCLQEVEMKEAGEALSVENVAPAFDETVAINAIVLIANSLATIASIVEKRYDPRDPDVL